MNRFHWRHWLALATLTCAGATAQVVKPTQADPLDPQASVPAAQHRSSLTSYRRHDETRLLPWREANDAVQRIGGWRAYAREAAAPEPAASAAPASVRSTPVRPAPAPAAPAGHKH
ncbi:MAG: hypothetical protein Q8N44_06690 [Rubrivivax sp.]|nr:hypothetical protein [Rubrivivax sp.]